ncbi:MAG: prolyl oligopeptidase family serine peptidase [Acidobacteriota bacterium]|nr:prolyl oligopeptidase family serine peptidase [Acidobacteriota bacterium]
MTAPGHPKASAPVRLRPSVGGVRIVLIGLAFCPIAHPQTPSQTPASSPATRVSNLLDALDQVKTPVSAAISPDSAQVAWTYKGARGSELHLTGIAARTPDRVLSPDTAGDRSRTTPGACTAGHPAWSPDGRQLAFLSDCTTALGATAAPRPDPARQESLWLWTPATNAVRQISHLHGTISDLRWSPDGHSIAFLFVKNATRPAGALDAMKPPSGVIGEDGVEIQTIAVIEGIDKGGNMEIALTDPSAGKGTHLHAYEFAWAPDSKHIVFIGAQPPGENNWWVAKLYWNEIPTWAGDTAQIHKEIVLFDPTIPGPLHGLQLAVPRFSPDGKQIAFIAGLMSDQGSTGGDIYLIPATGLKPNEQPRNLTPNRPASPAWIDWRTPHQLLVTEHRGGDSHITALDPATGAPDAAIDLTLPETIIAGFDVLSLSIAQNATAPATAPAPQNPPLPSIALIRSSYTHPPEVWAGPLTHLIQLTHLNDALKPSWGKAESVTWTNDGRDIQGWLVYPADYNPARRYPLLVSVHGGPSSAVTPRWPEAAFGPIPFSALGYFVFLPNPRGSYGQGETFTQANIKDFGYGDLRDVLAGMDLLEKRFPIDTRREGLTGWSYGGFMTMFAVTQTTRFHAAVAGAGIANWLSYYGENSIDQWMVPFFGNTVYDDPAVYARSSAINYIHSVKTPTLVVVGDRDGECPAPQSFEFWHALRAQGVKTQLVVYPNEGHHFTDPAHKKDVLRRALEWFEAQMPEQPGNQAQGSETSP